jgi:hypothetical protein
MVLITLDKKIIKEGNKLAKKQIREDFLKAEQIINKSLESFDYIIYGGYALNEHLLADGHPPIYDKSVDLPDIDIKCEKASKVSYDLAKLLYDAGFKYVRIVFAVHYGTKKVFFENYSDSVLDVSDTKIPYIAREINGIWNIGIPHIYAGHLLVLSINSKGQFFRQDKTARRTSMMANIYPLHHQIDPNFEVTGGANASSSIKIFKKFETSDKKIRSYKFDQKFLDTFEFEKPIVFGESILLCESEFDILIETLKSRVLESTKTGITFKHFASLEEISFEYLEVKRHGVKIAEFYTTAFDNVACSKIIKRENGRKYYIANVYLTTYYYLMKFLTKVTLGKKINKYYIRMLDTYQKLLKEPDYSREFNILLGDFPQEISIQRESRKRTTKFKKAAVFPLDEKEIETLCNFDFVNELGEELI